MKMKLFTLCVALLAIFGGGVFMLTSCCGDNDVKFDANAVTVKNTVATYDGQVHAIEIEGEIPEWVQTQIAYTKQNEEELTAAPVNAGIYNAVVSFKDENGNKVADDKTGTLTINKAKFEKQSVVYNITMAETKDGEDAATNIKAVYDADDDEYYFDIAENVAKRQLNMPTVTFNEKEYSIPQGGMTFHTEDTKDGEGTTLIPEREDNYNDFDTYFYLKFNLGDENYETFEDTVTIHITRHTHEIKTFADLEEMRNQVTELCEGRTGHPESSEDDCVYFKARAHRWVLRNDIDCENKAWTPIGRAYYQDTKDGQMHKENTTADWIDNIFMGEFDGNGYTISKFKITNKEFEGCLSAKNGINVGFFGYVTTAHIHDVNFDNETIEINKEGYTWNDVNPIYAGFVVGRIGSEFSGIYMENIKVTNSTMKLDGYKIMAGGIIGYEQYNNGEDYLTRDNLDLENVSIFATNKENSERVVVGGLVADAKLEAGTSVLKYTNCDLKNVKLGFDYEGYSSAGPEQKGNFISKEGIEEYVAAFAAYVRCPMKFENCTITNYLIARNGEKEYGYYSHVEGTGAATLEGCSYTNEQDWNGGVSGVYSKDGKIGEPTWQGADAE